MADLRRRGVLRRGGLGRVVLRRGGLLPRLPGLLRRVRRRLALGQREPQEPVDRLGPGDLRGERGERAVLLPVPPEALLEDRHLVVLPLVGPDQDRARGGEPRVALARRALGLRGRGGRLRLRGLAGLARVLRLLLAVLHLSTSLVVTF